MRPEYCFVDWFSTGYLEKNQSTIDYIDTIIDKFAGINCKLIFLFFLNEDYDNRLKFYSFCKEHLTSKGITFFDLNDDLKFSPEIMRDNVHTTEYGSKKYAELIFDKFEKSRDSIRLPKETRATKYNSISEEKISKIYTKNFKLSGNGEIIGFLMTVGTHSGIIRVTTKNTISHVNTWDKWCHYSRRNFSTPLRFEGNDIFVEVTNDTFDTNDCKNKSLNFKRKKKKVILHSIFYIGSVEMQNSFFTEYKAKILFLIWEMSNRRKEVVQMSKNTLKRILKLRRTG